MVGMSRLVAPNDPILTTVCVPYLFGPPVEDAQHAARVVAALKEEAAEHPTFLGLAANQVGINARVFVLEWGTGIRAFINPELFESRPHQGERAEDPLHGRHLDRYARRFGGINTGWIPSREGCLTLPGIVAVVPRRARVGVRYISEDGKPSFAALDGLLACAAQHEVDHLNGVILTTHPGAKVATR